MKMLRLFAVLTLLLGVIYPLTLTLIGRALFSEKVEGSLLRENHRIIGSKLLAQSFSRDEFFHSRPSATKYSTLPSGASQASPTQKVAFELLQERRKLMPHSGVDAWTSSGSGLDPHISPETAHDQLARVAAVRKLNPQTLAQLIDLHTEKPTLGIWGQPRVNVLELNMALITVGRNGNAR